MPTPPPQRGHSCRAPQHPCARSLLPLRSATAHQQRALSTVSALHAWALRPCMQRAAPCACSACHAPKLCTTAPATAFTHAACSMSECCTHVIKHERSPKQAHETKAQHTQATGSSQQQNTQAHTHCHGCSPWHARSQVQNDHGALALQQKGVKSCYPILLFELQGEKECSACRCWKQRRT